MSPLSTYLVLLSSAIYTVLIALRLLRGKWSALVELVGLAVFVAALHWTTGFPEPTIAFGGRSPLVVIALMYASIILGTVCSYLFYLQGSFSWQTLLRPICISPILLLPVMGSIQGSSHMGTLQLLSLALLAFQNGFFWKVIFERAKKNA